jgi:hypothetical protein
MIELRDWLQKEKDEVSIFDTRCYTKELLQDVIDKVDELLGEQSRLARQKG